MTDLTLPLKQKWFNEIRSGFKVEEYREVNDYWSKRLIGKTYDRIILTLGYPKAGDMDKRIILPWRGFRQLWLSHEHFQTFWPIEVFAINVDTRNV